MTPADDHLDDATAERLLAGRADSPELEPVATVVRALREASVQPVLPSTALREQMAAGVFTGAPAYSYRPATGGSLVRRVASAAAAKAGRLRLATKLVAAGLAAALLGTATAGFAGSLPEPVQDQFETVVESVTPYQFAEKTGAGRGNPATVPETSDPETSDPETSDPDTGDPGDGGGVSEDANDDGVEGPEVSEDAREREHGRPTDLPTPAQEAPGQQRRPTAPPGQRD